MYKVCNKEGVINDSYCNRDGVNRDAISNGSSYREYSTDKDRQSRSCQILMNAQKKFISQIITAGHLFILTITN